MGEVAEAVPPEIPSMARLVSQEVIDRYAAASGDFNPIHVDPEFARQTPFGGTIAHGMLVLAYVSGALTSAFGRRWWEGGRLKVRFQGPVRSGDTISVQVDPVREGDRWKCTVSVMDGEERVVSGTVEVPVSAGGGSDNGGD